jgi:hypothetical protein
MTAPKWIRKRRKVVNKLDEIMKVTKQIGKLVIRRKDQPDLVIDFKKDENSLDNYKFIKFFVSVFEIIKKTYHDIGTNSLDRKIEKFFMRKDPVDILVNVCSIIMEKWDKIEELDVIDPENLRFEDELSV